MVDGLIRQGFPLVFPCSSAHHIDFFNVRIIRWRDQSVNFSVKEAPPGSLARTDPPTGEYPSHGRQSSHHFRVIEKRWLRRIDARYMSSAVLLLSTGGPRIAAMSIFKDKYRLGDRDIPQKACMYHCISEEARTFLFCPSPRTLHCPVTMQ